jgi:hypothetical protein
MTLEQLYIENYALSDGEILSVHIDKENTATAKIKISAIQHLKKGKYRKCKLLITLNSVIEVNIFDNEDIFGNYSDITLVQLENKHYYISFDPFGNSNEKNEKDNYMFISENIEFIEL